MRLSGPDDVASLINVPSLASGVDIHYLASTETSMTQTRASLLKPNLFGDKKAACSFLQRKVAKVLL